VTVKYVLIGTVSCAWFSCFGSTVVSDKARRELTFLLLKTKINLGCTGHSTHSVSIVRGRHLMLCSEVIALRSEIHKNYINALCVQNVVFFTLEPMVHKAAIGS
jgi:hypothetical protein